VVDREIASFSSPWPNDRCSAALRGLMGSAARSGMEFSLTPLTGLGIPFLRGNLSRPSVKKEQTSIRNA
jgi:hypothetical protein